MNYVYAFDHPHNLPPSDVKRIVGAKAANIAVMANELGLPVPPGFTVSTAACNAFLLRGWPDGLEAEIDEHLRRVESIVGRRFGDPSAPLLVSVRSGAPVSMPGMMDTILNLGLNAATAAGLAASSGNPDFAADCHRRFVAMYRQIVGVDEVPDDPRQQLRGAIEAVFRSWNSDRARAYRRHEGIPDDLGTGVTVQAMVFGNHGPDSGTGVLFTRNPATGERMLYGDIMFGAQGEDVVAGTHRTEPLGVLDERMPDVAVQLREYADRLERHFADLCDIEFTIERGRLWLLQVRVGKRSPQAALRIAVEMAEDPAFPLTREEAVRRVAHLLAQPPVTARGRTAGLTALARGLPASPGIASGEVVTSPSAAVAAAQAGRRVILVRAETSPDDVHGMASAAGILTSRGGLASHAAVVARGWGIPAVVGAAEVEVGEAAVVIGGTTLAVGDTITIDGGSGEVFSGAIDGASAVVPEVAILLGWAKESGIAIGGHDDHDPDAAPAPRREIGPDDVVRALAIKGFATPEALAAGLLATSEEVAPVLERLIADGVAEQAAGACRLTERGRARGADLVAADRERWGVDRARLALDDFVHLDQRMKETVTAWQVREVDGAQVLNAHDDPAYDAAVIGRLIELDGDAARWLEAQAAGLPRLELYRRRLERAIEQVRAGETRYLASPRVDSYHSIWFELHEELIQLSGRSRADEMAAGRA